MTVQNPIQYISRTFLSIMTDINSDAELIDKPDWFKRVIAGVGDMLDMYLNATANQAFLRTAFTRQAVADLLELIDYQLTPHSTSSGNQIFYVSRAAALPAVFTAAELIAQSQSSVTIPSKRFEALTAETLTDLEETWTVVAATDLITIAGTYITGDLVRLSAATSLPTAVGGDLDSSTDYFVVYVGATTIRISRTLANAYSGIYIDITSTGVGALKIRRWSFSKSCYQRTTVTSQFIAIGNATTTFQEYDLPDTYILKSTVHPITLSINGDTWTRVDTFINSLLTDKHFRLLYKKDYASYIQFGDGVYGKLPGVFNIYASYFYGGGSDSNIGSLDRISSYAGSSADISGTSNSTVYTGGGNEESLEVAKINAPMLLKARDRFVTIADGEYLALNYGGVTIVTIDANYYGLLSCRVSCVPNGGGNMTAPFITALQADLISKTILDSIDVRVVDPTYITVNVTTAVRVLSGYTYGNIVEYFKLAWRLIFSEITQEILNDYEENGIASAVAIINTKWTLSFVVADYPQIQNLLDNVEPTDFAKTFQESTVLGFIQEYVYGVDYLTTTLTFPYVTTGIEITTAGTITSSAI